jgi:hypothetical protein
MVYYYLDEEDDETKNRSGGGAPLTLERYVALTVRGSSTSTGSTSESLLLLLEGWLLMSYNQITASCDDNVKGSFRILDEVTFVGENVGGATVVSATDNDDVREYVFALRGSCQGCLTSELQLFQQEEQE